MILPPWSAVRDASWSCDRPPSASRRRALSARRCARPPRGARENSCLFTRAKRTPVAPVREKPPNEKNVPGSAASSASCASILPRTRKEARSKCGSSRTSGNDSASARTSLTVIVEAFQAKGSASLVVTRSLRPERRQEMRMRSLRPVSSCLFALFLCSSVGKAQPAPTTNSIDSRTAVADGVKLHYLVSGRGPSVILLHGYAETSRMWRPLIPRLAEKFTVIAPDLPGIGDSDIPRDGSDMKTAAVRIHALVKSLGVEKARVVGHDIGLMVAYAYAAQFPAEVEKLVLMDAFLPGVAGWEAIYNNPGLWHFRFNGPTPEALVKGRERTYFAYYWNDLAADKTRSLPTADREAYVAAYSRPGRMHAGWQYFIVWSQTAKDFAQLAQTKLTIPVLAIGGEKSLGDVLGQQAKIVATDATTVVLENTGHWLMAANPQETMDALTKFL